MKTTKIIALIFCFLTTICFSQETSKTIVNGKNEKFEKTTLGKNLASLRNVNSKFRDKNFAKGQNGMAEDFSLPANQFIAKIIKNVFSKEELSKLNNTTVTLSGTFNVNGNLEDIIFYYPRNAGISVEKFELIEKGLVNTYKINITPLSQRNIKYVGITIKVNLGQVNDGSYIY